MPMLACHVCGRTVETTRPLESLSAEERRCPRCGSSLDVERRAEDRRDRRQGERRQGDRRKNPPDNPGPPGGIERRVAERRVADRRQGPRRREGGMPGGG